MGGHGWAHVMLWVDMGGHGSLMMVMVWVWVQIRRKMLGSDADILLATLALTLHVTLLHLLYI
jgi:hypothetical protein